MQCWGAVVSILACALTYQSTFYFHFGSTSHQGKQQQLGVSSQCRTVAAGGQSGKQIVSNHKAKLLTNCSLVGW